MGVNEDGVFLWWVFCFMSGVRRGGACGADAMFDSSRCGFVGLGLDLDWDLDWRIGMEVGFVGWSGGRGGLIDMHKVVRFDCFCTGSFSMLCYAMFRAVECVQYEVRSSVVCTPILSE